MCPGSLNWLSANWMSCGRFQLDMFSLVVGVLSVISGNTAQLTVDCQSVYFERIWTFTLWCVEVFTLLIPWMKALVCCLVSPRRFTHCSVIKFNWDALSSNTLHGTYWFDLVWTSTIAVANKTWLVGLLLEEQYVFTSAVNVTLLSTVRLVVGDLSSAVCILLHAVVCDDACYTPCKFGLNMNDPYWIAVNNCNILWICVRNPCVAEVTTW